MSTGGRSNSEPKSAIEVGVHPVGRFLMQVLWPAFLGAAVTVGVVFSMVDPVQIEIVRESLSGNRLAAYTIGFLILWVIFAFASAFTWFLATESR